MAKGTLSKIQDLDGQILKIAMDTLWEFAGRILEAIPANLRDQFTLTREDNRVLLRTESELAAYIEFGTGRHATEYLAGQPSEVSDDAIKFYISGEGTLPARPYLFPAYYAVKGDIIPTIDKRIQEFLDRV